MTTPLILKGQHFLQPLENTVVHVGSSVGDCFQSGSFELVHVPRVFGNPIAAPVIPQGAVGRDAQIVKVSVG